MLKRGFTLAEALITLGVVGLVAALTLPAMNKFKPDVNKALYLKTYDSVVDISQRVASSTDYYPVINGAEDSLIYKTYPLFNTTSVTIDGKTYSGNRKYCQILADAFNSRATSCSNSYSSNPAFSAGNISFVAQNGVEFMVFTKKNKTTDAAQYQSDIYFDINGIKEGKNCMFDASTCKEPDRFKLMVSSDAKVVASDKKGQNYLQTRTNFRKYDYDMGVYIASNNLEDYDYEKTLEIIPGWEPPYTPPPYTPPTPPSPPPTPPSDPELPAGHAWADWVVVSSLRTTGVRGIYCEQHNPSRPPGDYSMQRHVYWHAGAERWVELEGVYFVSGGNGYAEYNGEDAGQILVW